MSVLFISVFLGLQQQQQYHTPPNTYFTALIALRISQLSIYRRAHPEWPDSLSCRFHLIFKHNILKLYLIQRRLYSRIGRVVRTDMSVYFKSRHFSRDTATITLDLGAKPRTLGKEIPATTTTTLGCKLCTLCNERSLTLLQSLYLLSYVELLIYPCPACSRSVSRFATLKNCV